MFLLLACTEPPAAAPLPDDVLVALTSPDPTEELPERASVVDPGWAGFSPEGPGLPMEDGGWGEYAVVEAGTAVRVVARQQGVRTLVWVDRERLADRLYATTWVGVDGEPVAEGAPGIRLPAGSWVDIGEAGAAVRFDGFGEEARFAVADGLVDRVWRAFTAEDEEGAARALEREDLPFAMVERGVALRDDAGRVLFRAGATREDVGVLPARELRRDPKRGILVIARLGAADPCGEEPSIYTRGWVWPEETDALSLGGWGCGCSHCGGSFSFGFAGPSVALPAGALLFDAPDGGAVGITEERVDLPLGADDGAMPGWRAVLAPTPWGDAPLWARDAGSDEGDPDEEPLAGAWIEVRRADQD